MALYLAELFAQKRSPFHQEDTLLDSTDNYHFEVVSADVIRHHNVKR